MFDMTVVDQCRFFKQAWQYLVQASQWGGTLCGLIDGSHSSKVWNITAVAFRGFCVNHVINCWSSKCMSDSSKLSHAGELYWSLKSAIRSSNAKLPLLGKLESHCVSAFFTTTFWLYSELRTLILPTAAIEDIEVAPPKAHEVRIKILYTGV